MEDFEKKTLPIGTVVLLKNANKRLMIIGYCKYGTENREKVYDYAGCFYPEGFPGPEQTALFDADQIQHIYALGYQNNDQFAFREQLKTVLKKRAGMG